MHLQYLFTSSPLFGEVINSREPPENSESEKEVNNENNNNNVNDYNRNDPPIRTIVDELVEIGNTFTDLNILPICLV